MSSHSLTALVSSRAGDGLAPFAMKFKAGEQRDLSLGCGPITHEKAALSAWGGQVLTFYPSCCCFLLPMSDVRQSLRSHMGSARPGVCLLPPCKSDKKKKALAREKINADN